MKELHVRLYPHEQDWLVDIIVPPGCQNCYPRPDQDFPIALAGDPGILATAHQQLLAMQPGQPVAVLEAAGDGLYHFLFGAEDGRNALYDHWQACLQESQAQASGGMRLLLHLEPEAPELAAAPWELLRNEAGRYLSHPGFASPHTLLRVCWQPSAGGLSPVPFVPQEEPLRVLLAICSPDSHVQGWEEALRVDEALWDLLPWQVDLHVLATPDYQELQTWCQQWQPHVFHFMGHGTYSQNEAYLYLQKELNAPGVPVSPGNLSYLFKGYAPRLVVLNACRSGQAGPIPGAARAVRSFTERMIQNGALAVVAVQADIQGEAARDLMGEFYAQLTAGKPVDVALMAARERLSGSNLAGWDWCLPALYLAAGSSADQVIPLPGESRQAAPKVFDCCPDHADQYGLPLPVAVRCQVGNDGERRDLEGKLLRDGQEVVLPRILVLTGEENMGKTSLIFWLSECCARRGRPFLYASFPKTPAGSSLPPEQILRTIRDGRGEGDLRLDNQIDPDTAFNRFNYELNRRLIDGYRGGHPAPPAAGVPEPELAPTGDLAAALAAYGAVEGAESPLESMGAAFWNDLARIAEPDGLILFLDHVDAMSQADVAFLRKALIDRVRAPGSKVRLVIARRPPVDYVGDQDPWLFLETGNYVPAQNLVDLRGLPPEKVEWLGKIWARRYFLHCGGPNGGLWRRMVERQRKKSLLPAEIDEQVQKILDEFDNERSLAPGELVEGLTANFTISAWTKRLLKVGS